MIHFVRNLHCATRVKGLERVGGIEATEVVGDFNTIALDVEETHTIVHGFDTTQVLDALQVGHFIFGELVSF